MKSIQQVVSEGLSARRVPILLIGGMALPAYDVVRQTVDLDCLMVDAQEGEIGAVLLEAGYQEQDRTESFVRYTTASIDLSDVDVMLVDRETFDKLMDRSQPLDVGDTVMRVPCAAHMIMLKLHAIKNNRKREFKDLGDIVEILRNRPSEIGDDDLRAMCDRFGPDGVYQKVRTAL